MPSVSIILLHYRDREALFFCLESIYASRPKVGFEILVVDNDERQKIKKELFQSFPQVVYKKSPSNIGYSAGNNLGVSLARGKYVFILNPDTKLFDGTIDTLFDFMEKHKKAAVVGPKLVDGRGRPFFQLGFKELDLIRGVFVLSFLNKIWPKNPVSDSYWPKVYPSKPKCVEALPGSALFIRKKYFDEIGGFDENFFLFFEESDLCRRFRIAGYELYIVSEACVFHRWKEGRVEDSGLKEIFKRSRFYYFKKYYGVLGALLVEVFARAT